MGLEFEIDFTDTDVDRADKDGRVPPGWYRCVLEDVNEDTKVEGIWHFNFKVVAPSAHAGYIITDKIQHPSLATDTKKADISKKRLTLFAKRLGLVGAEHSGRAAVAIDWTRAIGVPVVLKCDLRKYQDKDTGEDKEIVNVTFDGLWPVNDERVPADVRQRLGIILQSGPGPTAVAGQAQAGSTATAATGAAAGSGSGGAQGGPATAQGGTATAETPKPKKRFDYGSL